MRWDLQRFQRLYSLGSANISRGDQLATKRSNMSQVPDETAASQGTSTSAVPELGPATKNQVKLCAGFSSQMEDTDILSDVDAVEPVSYTHL